MPASRNPINQLIHPYVGRVSDCDVVVDRTTCWGNPFPMPMFTRTQSILLFTQYAHLRWPDEALRPLKGRVLGCHCAPERCHAEVLALVANGFSTLEELAKLGSAALSKHTFSREQKAFIGLQIAKAMNRREEDDQWEYEQQCIRQAEEARQADAA